MNGVCGDNRFEIIAKVKEHLIKATNIEMQPEELKYADNILFRLWQLGYFDSFDKISKLEEQVADLKDKLNNLASVAEVRLGNWQKYAKAYNETQELLDKQIEATYILQEQFEMCNEVYNNNLDYSYHIEELLSEAKKLLAMWVSDKPITVSEHKDLIADTENFLMEVDK